jgi:hypothetical protein
VEAGVRAPEGAHEIAGSPRCDDRAGTQALRDDPEHEARAWLRKLAEADQKRSRYQEMAAEGLIDFDELRAKLVVLEETRETARKELKTLTNRRDKLAGVRARSRHPPGAVHGACARSPRSLRRRRTTPPLQDAEAADDDEALEMSGVLSEDLKFGEWETT